MAASQLNSWATSWRRSPAPVRWGARAVLHLLYCAILIASSSQSGGHERLKGLRKSSPLLATNAGSCPGANWAICL